MGILWIIQAPLVCMFLRISLPHLPVDPGNRNGNRKLVECCFFSPMVPLDDLQHFEYIKHLCSFSENNK